MTDHSVQCAGCGRELDPDHDAPERKPCPDCGSTTREHSMSAAPGVYAVSGVSISGQVERALNGVRLAVLGILVGIALTVGFGVPYSWWVQVLAGVGAFAAGCVLIRWRWSRNHLMEFMHRVTGH